MQRQQIKKGVEMLNFELSQLKYRN